MLGLKGKAQSVRIKLRQAASVNSISSRGLRLVESQERLRPRKEETEIWETDVLADATVIVSKVYPTSMAGDYIQYV